MSATTRDTSRVSNILGCWMFLSMHGRTGLTKLRSLEVLFAELPRHGTTLCRTLLIPCRTQLSGLSLPSQSETATYLYQSSEVSRGKAELEAQSATRFVTFRAPMRDLNCHLSTYMHGRSFYRSRTAEVAACLLLASAHCRCAAYVQCVVFGQDWTAARVWPNRPRT